MVEQLKKLETVVQALKQKVLSLEEEMTEIKKNIKSIEVEKGNEPKNISSNIPFKCTSSPIMMVNDPGSKVKVKEKSRQHKEKHVSPDQPHHIKRPSCDAKDS